MSKYTIKIVSENTSNKNISYTDILQESLPYEEITELLHASYKKHIEENRNFLAATQTVEQTRQRLENNICALAYDGDILVGTLSGKICDKKNDTSRKWYEDDSFVIFGQMAIRPEYQKTNILAMMIVKFLNLEAIKNLDSIIVDTSAEAEQLVAAYQKMGLIIVDLVSWETTNYYSYVFRKPIKGKKYSKNYCKWRYFWSSCLCKIRYTADGKRRFHN